MWPPTVRMPTSTTQGGSGWARESGNKLGVSTMPSSSGHVAVQEIEDPAFL